MEPQLLFGVLAAAQGHRFITAGLAADRVHAAFDPYLFEKHRRTVLPCQINLKEASAGFDVLMCNKEETFPSGVSLC